MTEPGEQDIKDQSRPLPPCSVVVAKHIIGAPNGNDQRCLQGGGEDGPASPLTPVLSAPDDNNQLPIDNRHRSL